MSDLTDSEINRRCAELDGWQYTNGPLPGQWWYPSNERNADAARANVPDYRHDWRLTGPIEVWVLTEGRMALFVDAADGKRTEFMFVPYDSALAASCDPDLQRAICLAYIAARERQEGEG